MRKKAAKSKPATPAATAATADPGVIDIESSPPPQSKKAKGRPRAKRQAKAPKLDITMGKEVFLDMLAMAEAGEDLEEIAERRAKEAQG